MYLAIDEASGACVVGFSMSISSVSGLDHIAIA